MHTILVERKCFRTKNEGHIIESLLLNLNIFIFNFTVRMKNSTYTELKELQGPPTMTFFFSDELTSYGYGDGS